MPKKVYTVEEIVAIVAKANRVTPGCVSFIYNPEVMEEYLKPENPIIMIDPSKAPPKAPRGVSGEVPLWKSEYGYSAYIGDHDRAICALLEDKEFLEKEQSYYPDSDIPKSIEKSSVYWRSEKAWELRKKDKTNTLNWKLTYHNALMKEWNRVRKAYEKPKNDRPGFVC